jgi:TolA-binding protein
MKKVAILIFVSLGIFLSSCSSENEKDLMKQAQEELKNNDYSAAIVTLEKITNEFPETQEAGEAYIEMAKLYQGRAVAGTSERESYVKAVQYYTKAYEEYPELDEAPGALFMCGFLQANELKDLTAAESTYKLFLEKYPNHELAASAQSELDNLGLTPEEILQKATAQPE